MHLGVEFSGVSPGSCTALRAILFPSLPRNFAALPAKITQHRSLERVTMLHAYIPKLLESFLATAVVENWRIEPVG